MKRMMGLMALAGALLLSSACTQEGAAPAAAPQNQAKKALLVGRDGGGDAILAKRLREKHGMEVTIVADKEVTTESAKGYGLIYVSESVNSGKIQDKFITLPVPVIYAEVQAAPQIGLSDEEAYGHLEGSNAAKTLEIKDSAHPLAAGLSGKVDVYKDNGKMGYATPGEDAVVIATVPGEEQNAAIFAYEKGATKASGQQAAAREILFYLFNGEEINQTEEGWKLFDAAVEWATGSKQ
ncbi:MULTISPECIES: hypothetical protein [Paenibacillus]|uniref:hypothetical protein n=1 Tax=Paenibacillus TaxID=44249 RepID=UPI0022B8B8BB|nr:hypothetical protein [Paenibacillus caseinilyticus]MCZ8519516.1 hypothetical protein [Paenibacillus caseinilyticus]